MVERRVCTFCGGEIEPGTGRMYIKKDGVVYNFCSSKCFKNLVELRRVPRRTTWTRHYEREKSVRMKGLPEVEEKPKVRKVKKEEPEKSSDEKEAPAEPQKEPEAEEEKPEERSAKKTPSKKAPKKKPEESKPSPESASDGDEKE